MVSAENFRKLALSFPDVTEKPHFEITSFRIKNKIFAALNPPHQRATLRLSPIDQNVFSLYDAETIYPVPDKWGKYGWTNVNLKKVPRGMLKDALTCAYNEVASHGRKKTKSKK